MGVGPGCAAGWAEIQGVRDLAGNAESNLPETILALARA
jgi:hypothetical protein